MEVIANETVKVVKNILGADASIKEVKTYFSGQKNNILLYLPAVLNIGELLNDSTLDDKTNKMEGPLSSLMQNIGSAFSKPVSDEETKNL
jgi:malate/lactate dehydrogenase